MGLGDLRHRLRADLCVDRHLGRGALDRAAHDPGHRRRRRMGRLGAAGDGMVAHPRPARPGRLLAAIRRALRAAVVESRDPGVQRMGGRRLPDLGLAHSVCALDRPGRRRPVDPARHPGDAGVPATPGQGEDREGPDRRSHQEAAKGDHPLGAAADVRTGAVLHLHRLHLRLRGRHAEDVATSSSPR